MSEQPRTAAAPAQPAPVMRTLTVVVTGPGSYVNPNAKGQHWAARARLTAAWRTASAWHHRSAAIGSGRPVLPAAQLEVTVHFPDRRRRDAANVSFKAAVDGAVDAGVLADDSDAYLRSVTVRSVVDPGCPPTLTLTWTEVAPTAITTTAMLTTERTTP